MSKNNYLFLLVLQLFCLHFDLHALRVRHMAQFVDEQEINGKHFSQTKVLNNGKLQQKFMVNHQAVSSEEFFDNLYKAQLEQLRQEQERLEKQEIARANFAAQVSLDVLEKLIKKLIAQTNQAFTLFEHQTLKPYYLFEIDSIASAQELHEMKDYLKHQIEDELLQAVESSDITALQEMVDKIESWPTKIEACFRNSVQHAIKECDDTATLKNLLALASE